MKNIAEKMKIDVYNQFFENCDKFDDKIDSKIKKIEKEFNIKFIKINGKRTLILDKKANAQST